MADVFTKIIDSNNIRQGRSVVVAGQLGDYSYNEPDLYESENSGQYLDTRLIKTNTDDDGGIDELTNYYIPYALNGDLNNSYLEYHVLGSGTSSRKPLMFHKNSNGNNGNPKVNHCIYGNTDDNAPSSPATIATVNTFSNNGQAWWRVYTRNTANAMLIHTDFLPNGGLRLFPISASPTASGQTNTLYTDTDFVLKSMNPSGLIRKIGRGGGIHPNVDAATITFNCNSGLMHKVTLTANRILAISNYAEGDVVQIRLTQDNGGSRTVTWWSNISWAGGSAPTLTTTGNKSDWITIICTANSGTFDGSVAMANV